MLEISDFVIELATWSVDAESLRAVRTAVFVEEQGIAGDDEFDSLDQTATHFIAQTLAGAAIGTARLSQLDAQTGQIGRVAVLSDWRGKGVGKSLIRTAIETARNMSMTELSLSAQRDALGLYQPFGFTPTGKVYQEVGIAHQKMQLTLANEPVQHRQAVRRQATSPTLSDKETSEGKREFQGRREYLAAITELLAATANELLIYTRDLETGILDTPDLVREIGRLSNQAARPGIRIIVQDANRAIKEGHLLIPLAQRKAGAIDFRIPGKDYLAYTPAFIIGDRRHTIFRELAGYPAGELRFDNRAYARPLAEYFTKVWDFGEHEPNFRSLNL